MLIANIVKGIGQISVRDSSLASQLLTRAGANSREATKLVQNTDKLNELEQLYRHLPEERWEEGMVSMKQVGRIHDLDDHLHALMGRDRFKEKLNKLISHSMAKAIVNLEDQINRATPEMTQVSEGPYLKGVNGKKTLWGDVENGYRIATRPMSYWQLVPFIHTLGLRSSSKPKGVEFGDPFLDLSPTTIQELIEILNCLSGRKYRLPTEAEWEKITGIHYEIIPLRSVLEEKAISFQDFLRRYWLKKYGNAFVANACPSNGHHFSMAIGGMIATEPEDLQLLWRDLKARPRLGLELYVWNLGSSKTRSLSDDGAWEIVTQTNDDQTPILRRVGLRYFSHQNRLRRPESPFRKHKYIMFRFAEDRQAETHRTKFREYSRPPLDKK